MGHKLHSGVSVAIKVAAHVHVVIAVYDGESCSMRHTVTCVCSGLLLPRDSQIEQAKLSCWEQHKSCNIVSRSQRLHHRFNFDGLVRQVLSLPSKADMWGTTRVMQYCITKSALTANCFNSGGLKRQMFCRHLMDRFYQRPICLSTTHS